jgi:predicted MFS family arabinose efflux permease
LYGWRLTFVILGLPGLLLAVLTALTLKEPRRFDRTLSSTGTPAEHPSVTHVFRTLSANATYRHLVLCVVVSQFFNIGILQWQPAFFMRTHGLQTGELGTWLAVFIGGGGLLGTYLGGELAFKYAANNERLQLQAIGIAYALMAVVQVGVYLSPNYYFAFILIGISAISGAATNGPLFAATQTLVPPHMRATAIAIVLFGANLIGMGLGPLAAGSLSDFFLPIFGDDSLRYSLVALAPGFFWCTWHLWQGSKTVAGDIAALRVESGSASIELDESVDSVGGVLRHGTVGGRET